MINSCFPLHFGFLHEISFHFITIIILIIITNHKKKKAEKHKAEYFNHFPDKSMNVKIHGNVHGKTSDGKTMIRRGLIALKDFAAGETIYHEEPILSVLEPKLEVTQPIHIILSIYFLHFFFIFFFIFLFLVYFGIAFSFYLLVQNYFSLYLFFNSFSNFFILFVG